MPSGPFAHVALLVRDLDQAIDDWTKILRVLDPRQLDQRIVRYDVFESEGESMRWATFVANHGCEIQLVEPAAGTALALRMEKHGEGVHHLCFTTDDVPDAMRRLAAEGAAQGDEQTFSDANVPWQHWAWISPTVAHGVLVEVARPYRAVDGQWEPAAGTS